MGQFRTVFMVLLLSMTPVIELRGAIPVGVAGGLDYVTTFVIAVIGNMLPVPFVILFLRKVLAWLRRRSRFFQRFAEKIETRSLEKAKRVNQYKVLGLLLFVAIPLPGTGAWTGSAIAALTDIRLKKAVPAILAGVIIAGLIMTLLSHSAIEALSFLKFKAVS